ncbi:MAG: hypothetical protein R3A12_00675 [Ignavibacteria bacterium]|nr:hypothetical protein [Ignavibacteriota bacterium]
MNSFKNYKIGKEKFITNDSGKIESVVLSIGDYNTIIELLEDYGLGLAMQEAEIESEKEGYLNKKEALKFL